MQRFHGVDVLRGLGIFVLLILHSAFYYFEGVYDLDLNNPPLIITIIGFLLMFAGLFAMISGFVHTLQMDQAPTVSHARKRTLWAGIFTLFIAFLYFYVTGPGIIHFETRTMNNSLLVEWIRNGRFLGLDAERLLYIDSLVMIGTNALLLGIVYPFLMSIKKNHSTFLLVLAIGWLVLSLIRIPLYAQLLEAFDQQDWGTVLLLNWLVNKNNPIFPYFAFALFGSYLARLYKESKVYRLNYVASVILVSGIIAYILLPDTMLERLIDLKWFAIMVIQIGLFLWMIRWFIALFKNPRKRFFFTNVLERFGIAGLTPFFLESILAALIYQLMTVLFGPLAFDIPQALLYGTFLAILWAILLKFYEKISYRYSIEYWYGRWISIVSTSSKQQRLERTQ